MNVTNVLVTAFNKGHVKCVDLLVRTGADVNRDTVDRSLALYSCWLQNEETSNNNTRTRYRNYQNTPEFSITETKNQSKNLSMMLFVAGET